MRSMEESKEAFDAICNKFKSGNSVPVERASVTRRELDSAFRYWLSTLIPEGSAEGSWKDFQEWLEDPFTHWINDQDAAWQAWQEQQEKIKLLEARIKNMEKDGMF